MASRSRPSQKNKNREQTGHRQMHFSLGDVKRNWRLEFNACLTLPMRRREHRGDEAQPTLASYDCQVGFARSSGGFAPGANWSYFRSKTGSSHAKKCILISSVSVS